MEVLTTLRRYGRHICPGHSESLPFKIKKNVSDKCGMQNISRVVAQCVHDMYDVSNTFVLVLGFRVYGLNVWLPFRVYFTSFAH